jgi:hypothetical protein
MLSLYRDTSVHAHGSGIPEWDKEPVDSTYVEYYSQQKSLGVSAAVSLLMMGITKTILLRKLTNE